MAAGGAIFNDVHLNGVDPKGRVSLPAAFRQTIVQLQDGDSLAGLDPYVAQRLRWPDDAARLTQLIRDRAGRVRGFTGAAGPETVEEVISRRLLGQTPSLLPLVERIASQGGTTRQELREAVAKPKPGRPKHYVFAFRPPTKAFNLKLSFNKSRATKDEVIEALQAIIRELRDSK